ncbi:hypothetical protein PENTCL1PPCAC_29503, partial [Pristionchus entomophagus]
FTIGKSTSSRFYICIIKMLGVLDVAGVEYVKCTFVANHEDDPVCCIVSNHLSFQEMRKYTLGFLKRQGVRDSNAIIYEEYGGDVYTRIDEKTRQYIVKSNGCQKVQSLTLFFTFVCSDRITCLNTLVFSRNMIQRNINPFMKIVDGKAVPLIYVILNITRPNKLKLEFPVDQQLSGGKIQDLINKDTECHCKEVKSLSITFVNNDSSRTDFDNIRNFIHGLIPHEELCIAIRSEFDRGDEQTDVVNTDFLDKLITERKHNHISIMNTLDPRNSSDFSFIIQYHFLQGSMYLKAKRLHCFYFENEFFGNIGVFVGPEVHGDG